MCDLCYAIDNSRDYLLSSTQSNDLTANVKPLVEVKRNSSSSTSWYCNRNSTNSVNVFCNSSNQSNDMLLYKDANKASVNDKTNYQTEIGNVNQPPIANQSTGSNQNTLQDQETKNAMQKYQGGMSVPLVPSNEVKMNINQQQLQFNIKY